MRETVVKGTLWSIAAAEIERHKNKMTGDRREKKGQGSEISLREILNPRG